MYILMPLFAAGMLLGAPAAHVDAIHTDSAHGIVIGVPNPTQNMPADFYSLCAVEGSNSTGCAQAILNETNAAVTSQGGQPFYLPPDYTSLSSDEQLFLLTNLDRGAFGLGLVAGLNATLTADAQLGADNLTDPNVSFPFAYTDMGWNGNWADDINPLASNFNWMFDDGPGSGNIDCTTADPKGCWGHRDNLLTNWNATLADNGWNANGSLSYQLIEGTGAVPATLAHNGSYTTMMMAVQGTPPVTYTWNQALNNYQGQSPWSATKTGNNPPSPTPPPPAAAGTLWRVANTNPVYIVTSGYTLYHIPSPLAFHDLQAQWDAIHIVSSLPNIALSSSMAIPTGSLWRVQNQNAVYMVTPENTLYHIPNPSFFRAFNNQWSNVRVVGQLPALSISSSFA